MQIIADVRKVSKAVQRNFSFILMLFQNVALILPSFQQFLLKRMLVFSNKIVLIENKAALLCVTMRERAQGICSYNAVYNVLIQILPLKSLAFVVHFLNAFWHGSEAFPKGSLQSEIVLLLVVFYLPYSKHKAVKICFYWCRYQNQNFSLVSHSCRSCSIRVALVSFA